MAGAAVLSPYLYVGLLDTLLRRLPAACRRLHLDEFLLLVDDCRDLADTQSMATNEDFMEGYVHAMCISGHWPTRRASFEPEEPGRYREGFNVGFDMAIAMGYAEVNTITGPPGIIDTWAVALNWPAAYGPTWTSN